jgi:Flp pilus assembly protein TadG
VTRRSLSPPSGSHPTLFARLRACRAGTATIEFALMASSLLLVMLNGVEIARFHFAKMELQNAVQMASQAVWKLCDSTSKTPTSTNCTNRDTKITTSLQSTSLGTGVSLSSGFPTEGWFCINSTTGALQSAGSTKPADCSAYGGTSAQSAGYYVTIQAQYTYAPIFSTVTVGGSLPTTVTAKTVTRLL